MKRTVLLLIASGLLTTSSAPADDLPRRGMIGVRLAPSPDGSGIVVAAVVPDSSAAEAGLQAADVIVEVAGSRLTGPQDLGGAMQPFRAGDTFEIKVRRGAEELTKSITLKPRPRESAEDIEVEYGQVVSRGDRLRTILTRPKDAKRAPALLFIQGLSCSATDGVGIYVTIFHEMSRKGFVTLRVEKPGEGDSEGGPCGDIDFDRELDAYRQALLALRKMDCVDPENIFIFGHSMGGIFGPVLAAEIPVRGVAVYGTGFRTWIEYMLENNRRQAYMAGVSPAEIEEMIRQETRLSYELLVAKHSPKEIAAQFPELAEYLSANYPDGERQFGRHYRFFQQLYDVQTAEVWGKVDAHVLALYGGSDFVTAAEDHRLIAETVNRAHPGHGEWRVLEKMDHAFSTAETPEIAMQQGMMGGAFDDTITKTLLAWMQEKCSPAKPD